MNYTMLVFLMLSNFQGTAAQTEAQVAEVHASVRRAQALANKASKLPGFTKAGSTERRLVSGSDIDYPALCQSECWTQISSAMVTMVANMEKNCPVEPTEACDLEAEKQRWAEEKEAQETGEVANATCAFDMCQMDMGVGTLDAVCNDAEGLVGVFGPDTLYNMSLCTLSSFQMICDGFCSTACQTNNAEERKFMCAPRDPSEVEEAPVECKDDSQSSQEMEDMLNLMCSQNENGEYCQAIAAEWEAKGAFSGDPTEVFPDPCVIDCSEATGQAIAAMGCCWGSFINVAERNTAMMAEEELRAVKAATFKCAGVAGMSICNTGTTVPTEVLAGKMGVQTCPATTLDLQTFVAQLAVNLEVTSSVVAVMTCIAGSTSCEGGSRRLTTSSSASLTYTVKVSGSDSEKMAAKKASVTSKILAEEVKAPVPTSDSGNDGASAATSTGNSTDTGNRSAMVSLAGCDSMSLLVGMLIVSRCLQ